MLTWLRSEPRDKWSRAVHADDAPHGFRFPVHINTSRPTLDGSTGKQTVGMFNESTLTRDLGHGW